MDAIVISATIGAVATVGAATIGALAALRQVKIKEQLAKELKRRDSSEKAIKHYLLFWWRSSHDWGKPDWEAAQEYIAKFQPTCGFSRFEAANADMVTIVGATGGTDDGAEIYLEGLGCKVERLDGKTFEDTAQLFSKRVIANKAFEGGIHRRGY